MRLQAAHVLTHLQRHVRQKLPVHRIHGAREHHVLPDQNTEPIGARIELVALVQAAAPDAQHVHVDGGGRREQVIDGRCIVGPFWQNVTGDPVRALHEDIDVVQAELESVAVVCANFKMLKIII